MNGGMCVGMAKGRELSNWVAGSTRLFLGVSSK